MLHIQKNSGLKWSLGACIVGVMCAAAFADDDVVSSETISRALTRDLLVDAPVADDGYTDADASSSIGLSTILFELDSARLTSDAQRQLDEVIDALADVGVSRDLVLAEDGRPQQRILIEGHTCDLGAEEHNLLLSRDRALAVREYLTQAGVASEALEVRGWGEARPIAPNAGEAERAQNRRVVFVRRLHASGAEAAARDVLASSESWRTYLRTTFTAKALSEGGRTYRDDEIRTLHSGDQFQLSLRAVRGCFAYVFVRNASERVTCLFPPQSAPRGLWVNAGDEWRLPAQDEAEWYTLDDSVGTEIVSVIATSKAIEDPNRVSELLVRAGETLTAEALEREADIKHPELVMLVIDHQP